ncbi:MAG: alpha/beta fold hydrolase, partial [Candidatus Saccharimonadales bacterium]
GLPAENRAIKEGMSPQESMAQLIPDYRQAYKAMGWSNDWEKEIATHLPEYYKWTQWLFSEMHRNGLAYQDSRMQWWCEKDNTVLANEQVIDGKCWRHDGPDDPLVEKKEIKQWFFKITDYADELLDAIEDLDWTDTVKLAQKNWIGRSVGAEVDFVVDEKANYIDLHGFTGTPESDFHPWLAAKLAALGRNVQTPALPNTDNPTVTEQADFVLENCNFDESTVLIGHSLGTPVALKVTEKLNHPIKRLVLVAAFAEPGFLDHQRPFEKTFDWDFDFEKIKKNVQDIVILRAKNDSVVPRERANYIAERLNARIVDFVAEANHVCGQEEPEVFRQAVHQIKVFTTRPDTLFGATFMVLAPEHELVQTITTAEQQDAVQAYARAAQKKSELERQTDKQKTGVFTGAYGINPVSGARVPIWIADYVLAGYGTGAIMAVPAHDERDAEFAQAFDLPVIEVIDDANKLINSGEFDGQNANDARETIVRHLEETGQATAKVNYKMRDWSVSRQRYWGAPIPIINCPKDGAVLVPDDQLPVVLPELDDFKPAGDGRSALARATDWLKVTCPECGGEAERETDTLDTYICSSWYMYRYMDPRNQQQIFDSAIVNKWEPIDFYNGGDHATAHLLYARFIGHFFKRLGLVNEPEPFKQFLFNGKITAADGTMFSKSKG